MSDNNVVNPDVSEVETGDDTAVVSPTRSVAYQPNRKEDGTIDFGINRDSTYYKPFDFDKYNDGEFGWEKKGKWVDWSSPVGTVNDYGFVRAFRDLGFDFSKYSAKDNDSHKKIHGTNNDKMTFVLTAEQKAQYDAGQMPYGLNPLNPDNYSGTAGGKQNFSVKEAYNMLEYMKSEVENGGCVLQLNRHEYEKVFGVPYIEPVDYQNDEQFGDAIKGMHQLRPGAQIFLLTDAEIRDIRDGRGFTALPTNLAYDQTGVDKSIFKGPSAELGAMAQNAMSGRSDVKLYMFTPEEIAMYNGRDPQEVIEESIAREEQAKLDAKQAEWENSTFGKLTTFLTMITSSLKNQAARGGDKFSAPAAGEITTPPVQEIQPGDTPNMSPADFSPPDTTGIYTETPVTTTPPETNPEPTLSTVPAPPLEVGVNEPPPVDFTQYADSGEGEEPTNSSRLSNGILYDSEGIEVEGLG